MSGFAVIEITAAQQDTFTGKNTSTGEVTKYRYDGILSKTEGKVLEYKPVVDMTTQMTSV